MKANIIDLRTVIYKENDLVKATAWYTKAFKQVPYCNEVFYVGFNIGGYELGLLPEEGSAAKADNIVTYWGVENIEETYKHFIELGATAHEEPNNVGGEIMVATVKDPWENCIGLIFNPEFKLPRNH
jgi:predicted enzyme related to lactoylglutathione lyase